MLIYKNVKGNKCSGDNTYAECNKALDPNEYDNKNGKKFLLFQRCIHMTYDEYNNQDYINDNIYCDEFISNIEGIKSGILNNLRNLQKKIKFTYGDKIPLPIYVMIAKIIQEDLNDENANGIKKFLKIIKNKELANELKATQSNFKNTSMIKYTFQGNYKVVIYIPNLMKIKRGNFQDMYSYFPSLDSCSRHNRWMNYLVSDKSKYFRIIQNNKDYISDYINKVGAKVYYNKSEKQRRKKEEQAKIKNEMNMVDDFLFLELEKSCANMGCVSEGREDFDELVPKYSSDSAEMDKNAENKSPYYPSKCLQTKNYSKYMFDDSGSGEGDDGEKAKKKKNEYEKKAIELMEKKYKSEIKNRKKIDSGKEADEDAFNGSIESLIKTSVSEARSKIYNEPGKAAHEYSKVFNNNILKDLAKRNGNIPGIPEYSFVMYKLNLKDDLFQAYKDIFHYMPWGDILLTGEYVLNEGDIIRSDDVSQFGVNYVPFKSFNETYNIKFSDDGFLSLYKNDNFIKIVDGAENKSMKGYKNRYIKCELNNINIYASEQENNDLRNTIPIKILDNKAKLPSSLIIDPISGNILVYDLGYNLVN
jgi:hypothetical protein